MAASVTHAHVSEIADDPTKDVSSGEWNAAHTVSGLALLENGVQYGTDWPTSPAPTEGMFCYRTDRDVLYLYNGTAWVPIESFAAITIYVDPTGTDDADHGFASGTDAFLTVTYALSQVPPLYGGNVIINIAAGTYTENVVVRGKNPTGDFTLTLQGVLAEEVSTTMNSGVQGTAGSTTQAAVTKTSAGWTTDAYSRMLCKFTSGTNDGTYRVIEANTADTLTLVGQKLPAAPGSGDSFKILSHGSIIAGTLTCSSTVYGYDLKVTGLTMTMVPCYFYRMHGLSFRNYGLASQVQIASFEAAGGANTFDSAAGSISIYSSLLKMSSSGICLLVRQLAGATAYSSICKGDGGAAPSGLVLCRGFLETAAGATDLLCITKSTSGTGLVAAWGGHLYQRSLWGRVSVTTEYSAESASYSYVA